MNWLSCGGKKDFSYAPSYVSILFISLYFDTNGTLRFPFCLNKDKC